ncbi:hypothetical protein CR513_40368, partial [Mucuna pruriens]
MENNNNRMLKELATPDILYQPWCIQYLQLEPAQTYELKSRPIHLLPKFHGLVGEDPHKHLKEFNMVCSTIRPQGIPKDYIKMKAFLKRLIVFATGFVQHIGRYEANVPREVLLSVQDSGHRKRDLRNPLTCGENVARILGKI